MLRYRMILAAAMLLAAPPAQAVTLTWSNAGGGSADTPGNWSPVQAPTLSDLLLFNLANSYTVTFGSPLDSVTQHLFYGGNVTFDCPSPHYGGTLFSVAPAAGNVATLSLVNGNLRMGYDARVGDAAGATGTLQVQGASASLTQAKGSPFKIGNNAGTGTLKVLAGGQAAPAGDLVIGNGAGSHGTVTISGEVTSPAYQRSQLTVGVAPTALTTRVGEFGGVGTLQVLNGAAFTTNGPLTMARYASDSGVVRVGGIAATDSARATIVGGLDIAYGIGGGQPGGFANFVVDSNGVVFVNGTTRLGSPNGSSATLRVRKDARFMTRGLYWEKAGGDLDLPGGLLQVFSGAMTTSDDHLKLNSNVAKPTLEFESGAHAAFAGTGNADTALVVGALGQGRFRLTGGSSLTVSNATSLLGQEAGSLGELVLRDGSTFSSTNGRLVAGRDGRGELHVLGGSSAVLLGLHTGYGAGTGIVEVRGTGSTISVSDVFFYLPNASGNGGTGDVTVGTGGAFNLPNASGAAFITLGGALHVESDGTLNCSPHDLYVRDGGLLDLQGGVANGTYVHVSGGGNISGFGTLNAHLWPDGTDTTGVITATGPLQIGVADGAAGFSYTGLLDVGADTVTILDGYQSTLGRVSLSGGRLLLPAVGGEITRGRELYGRGTVVGSLTNLGQLRSVGAAGLRFKGAVTGVGVGIVGDLVRFLAGGSFIGTGTIGALVSFDSLSTLTATGPLTIGTSALDSPVLQGRIVTGSNRIEFASPSNVILGDEVVFDNGRLAYSGGAAQFELAADGTIRGRGIVEGNLVASGTLSPGASPGRLRVVGNLTLDGTYVCELGNLAAGENDSLVSTGTLQLAGTLDVRRLASFLAHPGDSVRVAQGSTRSGVFTTLTIDGMSASGILEAHYTADAVYLYMLPGVTGVGDGPGSPGGAVSALRFAATGSPGPAAALELALPEPAEVDVRLFDVTGREVARLEHGVLGAGLHRFALPAGTLPAGVLFARAELRGARGSQLRTTRVVSMR